jgi:xanthine dehydrogenase accessory factor
MSLFKKLAVLLSEGEDVVLATILNRSGSAPRAVGSRMVVRSDGSILGTIGGGILEARVQEFAREVFETRKARVSDFTLTAEDASRMGMICGGNVRVLIHHVDAAQSAQSQLYQDIGRVLEGRRQAWLVTAISQGNGEAIVPEHGLVAQDDSYTGTLDRGLVRKVVAQFSGRQPDVVWHGDDGFLVEPLGREGSVLIFGAGHVSRELAPLTRRVGFHTIVLDDRREFANRDRFPLADEVIVLDSFEGALNDLTIDAESYLVVVTRGHAHDETVLRRALSTNAGYIGMIGSRRKRNAIYESLLGEGFTNKDLERVHSPIGLNIAAETPEEIAVSIVAELIQVRAEKN